MKKKLGEEFVLLSSYALSNAATQKLFSHHQHAPRTDSAHAHDHKVMCDYLE